MELSSSVAFARRVVAAEFFATKLREPAPGDLAAES